MTLAILPGIEKVTGSKLPVDLHQLRDDLFAYRCEQSLYEFTRHAWRYLDPAPFVPGWHLEAIAEHLQAVCDGQIKRLIINQPPRTSKSTMLVAFDAWVWAQPFDSATSGSSVQFLHSSYAQTLSMRDSLKTRRLLESPWYQKYWGKRFQITSDQNTKIRFENDKGGYRIATSTGGTLTGEGGSVLIIDDPHSATEVPSETFRQSTIDWFDQSLSTRLNDPNSGAMILVMQRLHEEDLTGHILSNSAQDWVHLMLPMRYEGERAKLIYPNAIGWSDPRTVEDQLLCPERFDAHSVDMLERQLGPYGASGQLQQRPQPKGGEILKREWWQHWSKDTFPALSYIVASLDCAYTEKQENDYSALTVWGVWNDAGEATALAVPAGMRVSMEDMAMPIRTAASEVPKIILMYAWQERLAIHDLVNKVSDTCRKMKVDRLLIENKASGISVSQELRRLYGIEKFGIQMTEPGNQDKVARAYAVQHLLAEGLIYAPTDKDWADMVITQCESFPKGKHDDLVDTLTQGLKYLRTTGLITRAAERASQLEDSMTFRGNKGLEPLYPS